MSLGEREDELLDTQKRSLMRFCRMYSLRMGDPAFNQRSTTDVDVVIPAESVDDYTDLLTDRGYEKSADVERSNLYEGRTIRFEKAIGIRFGATRWSTR